MAKSDFWKTRCAKIPAPSVSPEMLARLDKIQQGVERTSVPRSYADYSYHLRAHIELVRNHVLRLAQAEKATAQNAPSASDSKG